MINGAAFEVVPSLEKSVAVLIRRPCEQLLLEGTAN